MLELPGCELLTQMMSTPGHRYGVYVSVVLCVSPFRIFVPTVLIRTCQTRTAPYP